MDKPKPKDGMLAAGKKRLEQFRQKKQGKGSSSKQNKQETGIEHGRSSSEAENASRKSSKAKSSNDLEGIKAKGSRMHTLSDDQMVANNRFGDDSKVSLNDLIIERSGDGGSSSSAEHKFASAIHAEGNTSEQRRVSAEDFPAEGNGELCLTINSLDSLQSQPSSGPSSACQLEKPLDQECSDSAGASDLSVNMADLVAPDFSRDHNVASVERGTSEPTGILWCSPNAFQAYEREQQSSVESCLSGISPCSSYDYPAVIATEIKSEYGDEMQANHNTEDNSLGSSFSSLMVPNSLLSTSGGDEGETSQPGEDFVTSEGGMIPGSLDGLENVVQGASMEEEPSSSYDYPGVIATEIKSDYGDKMQTNHSPEDFPSGSSFSSPTVPNFLLSTSGGEEASRAGHDFVTRKGGMIPGSFDGLENIIQGASKEEEPCLSSDYTEIKSEYDDEMQANNNTEDISPGSTFSSPMMSNSPLSTSGGDEGDTSRAGHDFITREGGMILGSTDGLDNVVQGASKEEEPCSSSDFPAVIVTEIKSEYGDEMQANHNTEDISPGPSFSTPLVPDSLLSTSGGDEGDTSQAGGMIVGFMDVSENLVQGAIKEEEPCSSVKSRAETNYFNESTPEPKISSDTDVLTTPCSEVDTSLASQTPSLDHDSYNEPAPEQKINFDTTSCSEMDTTLTSQTPNIDNAAESYSHAILVSSVLNENCSFEQSQTGSLDGCLVEVLSDSSLDHKGLILSNAHGFEGSEDACVPAIAANATESHSEGIPNESSTNECCDYQKPHEIGEWAVDRCSKLTIEEVGDACTGSGSLKHEVAACSLEAKRDLTTVEQEMDDVISEKLEADSLSPPCGDELKSIEKVDVCHHEPDLESNFAEPSELFSNLEHVLSAQVTSKVADSVELPDACRSYEAVSFLASPGVCVDEVPLVMVSNKALEKESDPYVPRPLLEDLDTDIIANYNRNTRNTTSLSGMDSMNIDDSSSPLEVGQDIQAFNSSALPLVNEEGSKGDSRCKAESTVDNSDLSVSCAMEKSRNHHLEELLLIKESEIESLQKLYAEEREGHLSMCTQASALADKYEAVSKENKDLASKVAESDAVYEMEVKTLQALVSEKEVEKVNVEGVLKQFQDLYVEHESKARHLEELLSKKGTEIVGLQKLYAEEREGKDSEIASLQKLYAEERDGHLSMRAQASALADKVSALLGPATESIDRDTIGTLDILVASLHEQYEAVLRENKDLASRAAESDAVYEMEVKTLQALVSEKEVEKVNVEGVLKQFQDLCAEQESKTRHLEELLSKKYAEIEGLQKLYAEEREGNDLEIASLQKLYAEEREGHLSMRTQASALADKVSALLGPATESIDRDTIGTLDLLVASLHEQYESVLKENKDLASRAVESDAVYEMEVKTLQAFIYEKEVEKVNVEGVLKQFQDLCVEQERKTRHLEELLSKKDAEIEGLQKLYAEERERHSSMRIQAIALADKVTALLGPATEDIDGDTIGTLDMLVASLYGQYEATLRENKDLALRAIEADEAHEMEMKTLQALVSEKEIELGHSQEKVDCLTEELSKTKEDWERKLLEAEQKALGVRERLSLAVTKGKGLVQQRDNLKQMLAEKTAEVEALVLSYQQELHAKAVALNEAESKAKLNAEAGERVEALESELSYIRNSANALRESFLQKDAVLQKIEELLEDAGLPEELQINDTYEKVEWLLEASHHKTSNSEEKASEIEVTRELDPVLIAEQASHMQEIEQLNRKCDEYVRKYRGMAEELAMLEQSLLERNLLIQRWEEMLDNVDMPASVRSKEPEDKIQWLGTAVFDANNSIDHLQADTERLLTTIDTLNHSLQKLQQQNAVLSAELVSKEDELRAVTLDFEDMTRKVDSLSKPLLESSNSEASRPVTGTRDLQVSENNPEESQKQSFQIGNPDVFITEVRMFMSEVLQEDEVDKIFADVSTSEAFESSMKLLVEKSKVWFLEATETKEKLSELTLAMREAEEDNEKALQNMHQAFSSKTFELNNLNSQLEGFGAKITSLEDEVDQLQKELKVKMEELSFVRDDLNKSQLEVSQGEEKLASVREKLSMAVKKGKSVVQQRDTLKHSLDEKVAELDQLRKDYEAESVAFTKAKQSFKNQLQELEAELSSSRKYVTTLEKSLQENNKTIHKFGEALDKFATSGAPRSGDLMEKIQWTSQLVMELQRKVGSNEQEAKKSKKAAELLALELEEVQGRMDSLADELMHAEKTISLLTDEKKVAEASKADAGLRLEHAMANVNSLLFELSEYKEAQANLEQENSSLKDSLAAQMEEIRFKHTKTEEQLKDIADLYNKVHALKANQSILFGNVADEILKLSEDLRGTKNLIVRMSGELKEQGLITMLAAPAFVENFPSKWEPESLNKGKTIQEWKQGVTTSSIRLLCEEMEMEFQHFDTFLTNIVIALTQESAVSSQLLLELCNGLGSVTKKLEALKRDADFASSSESSILQKDEQIRALEEVLKVVAEKVRSSVEDVEELKKQSGLQIVSAVDDGLPVTSTESVQNIIFSLVERLTSSVEDLAQSCQQVCIESEKQNEGLRCQLREAKDAINSIAQQKQLEKLKLQKCLEEFEGRDDIFRRTNQELCSLHEMLMAKNQEEKRLLEALEKAESKVGELSTEVEELEKAKQELEASLGKASSRFHATVDNFNKFRSLSEKLIEEAESLHLLLEDRDAQISLLKDEVAHKASEVTDLQSLVNERTADLCQVYKQIGGIVNRDASNGELLPDSERRRELLEALAMSVRAGSESLRVQLARKDALLQDVQLRHDDMARKVLVLESTAQENLRLMEERGANEHMMITVEAEEKGNRGKHATPSVALVTHGRAGRKVSAVADHSALDIDAESGRLLADVEDEDKGHMFKPLTSSRLVPRGTRMVVDRLDGLWVSGERLLRRRPSARLSVMLYWLVLHMWMVAILL